MDFKRVKKGLIIASAMLVMLTLTISGIKDYQEKAEAKRAFQNFYHQDGEVKGVYTTSGEPGSGQAITFFLTGFLLAMPFFFLYGRYTMKKRFISVPAEEKQLYVNEDNTSVVLEHDQSTPQQVEEVSSQKRIVRLG